MIDRSTSEVRLFRCAAVWTPAGIRSEVDLGVADGLIASITAADPAQRAAETLPGLVFPGFADAHSHVFHRALRGRTHDGGGTFWTWRELMYSLAGRLDPDRLRALAVAAYAELICAGYTAVGEFHYLHHQPDGRPYADHNAMGLAIADAATDVGIALTLLDTCYLAAGFDVELEPVQRRFSDVSVSRWLDRVAAIGDLPGGGKVGLAVHSVRAVPPPALPEVAAGLGDRVLHVHLSEQQAENAACLAATGLTPTGLLDEAGLLGPKTAAVHATHLTVRDIAALGASGGTAVICPTTEADLADGLPAVTDLVAAGVPLACGGDQQVIVDPFAQARGIEYGERLRTGRRGAVRPADVVTAATSNSHRSIGSAGGSIVVGAPADFVAVRTDSARTAGSDPAQLVLTASAADVAVVVASGAVVARDGVHLRLGDPGGMLESAVAAAWR